MYPEVDFDIDDIHFATIDDEDNIIEIFKRNGIDTMIDVRTDEKPSVIYKIIAILVIIFVFIRRGAK